jgi:hypothetical protein
MSDEAISLRCITIDSFFNVCETTPPQSQSNEIASGMQQTLAK